MIKHVVELHNHLKESSHNKASDWTEVMKRVKNQVVLRIVSCIQIASKLTSHHRVRSVLHLLQSNIFLTHYCILSNLKLFNTRFHRLLEDNVTLMITCYMCQQNIYLYNIQFIFTTLFELSYFTLS